MKKLIYILTFFTLISLLSSCTSVWENPKVEKLTNVNYLITLQNGNQYVGQGQNWLTYPEGNKISGCSCKITRLKAIVNAYELSFQIENLRSESSQAGKTKLEPQ
jgi:hypothetical protein